MPYPSSCLVTLCLFDIVKKKIWEKKEAALNIEVVLGDKEFAVESEAPP